jgi:hypothetical protein
MNYDFQGWDGDSAKPPMTHAKEELVAISRTPQEQFLAEWVLGELAVSPHGVYDQRPVARLPALLQDERVWSRVAQLVW